MFDGQRRIEVIEIHGRRLVPKGLLCGTLQRKQALIAVLVDLVFQVDEKI